LGHLGSVLFLFGCLALTEVIFGKAFCVIIELDPVREFPNRLICLARQAAMGRFEFPFGGDRGIVTLFSAPNYCGNKGSVLRVNPRLFSSPRSGQLRGWAGRHAREARR
jgi:hypothetical protein